MKRSLAQALRAGLILSSVASYPPARSFAEDEPAVAVRAVFETRVDAGRGKHATQRWSVTRRANDIEYHFFGPDVTERWSRDARGNLSCVRMFHRENTAVRYTHGDLLAFGIRADWTRLESVLARLRSGGFVAHVSAPGRRVRVRLVELTNELPPPIDLTRFRQIDVADFGDLERDPFVLRHHDDPRPTGMPAFGALDTSASRTPSRNDARPSHVTDSRHAHWGMNVRRLRARSD